jgi:hypothetical protein
MNAIVLAVLMLGGDVTAAPATAPPSIELTTELEAGRPRLQLPKDLLLDAEPVRPDQQAPRISASGPPRSSPAIAKIVGVAVGAVGGFYAGGMIGYGVAQDRNRDDDGVSGLRGVVIGAPLGAVLGGLLGYHLAK